SDTLTVNALADTVATVMVRLYNIELPVSFVASLHWRNTTTRAPDQRAYEYGAAPWVQQHWTWTPEAVTPHNLPAEIVSTLSEPGLARCPNDLITKSIRQANIAAQAAIGQGAAASRVGDDSMRENRFDNALFTTDLAATPSGQAGEVMEEAPLDPASYI
ncbi:unnamed protein product, partial [Durusdinium trenchii]